MYLETPKGERNGKDLDVVNLLTLRGLIENFLLPLRSLSRVISARSFFLSDGLIGTDHLASIEPILKCAVSTQMICS